MKAPLIGIVMVICASNLLGQSKSRIVSDTVMRNTYEEIKTPHKYGLVMVPEEDNHMMDSPTVFRKDGLWHMVYIIFDGKGYETWLATSKNLKQWESKGKIMSFSGSEDWDATQKAGYPALQDFKWGGSYKLKRFNSYYWMSYLGGNALGYEAGLLSVGMANTRKSASEVHEWKRLPKPVIASTDKDVRWWESNTIYKSSVIWDKSKLTGSPFVMYYNAKGDSIGPPTVERIGMAVSDDMMHWRRLLQNPVMNHHEGITGDAYIQKIGDLWIMFYFGAFWTDRKGAFNRFACSYDLINWTDWEGENLIQPSEPYDSKYAHKSFVLKWDGVVYHFYCAVNDKDQRGIALATSTDLGKSTLSFIAK